MAALEISSHPPSPIRQIEDARLERLKQAPSNGPHAMVRLLARVIGVGVETADMLVQEVLSRNMRDRRAIARWPLQASFFCTMLQVDTLLVPAERLSYGCFRMRDGRDVLGASFSAHELQRTSSSPTIELQCCKSRTWCGRKSSGGCHTTVRFPFLNTARG